MITTTTVRRTPANMSFAIGDEIERIFTRDRLNECVVIGYSARWDELVFVKFPEKRNYSAVNIKWWRKKTIAPVAQLERAAVS